MQEREAMGEHRGGRSKVTCESRGKGEYPGQLMDWRRGRNQREGDGTKALC